MSRRRPVAGVATVLTIGLSAWAVGGCDQHDHRDDHREPSCAAPPFPAPYSAINPCSPDPVLIGAADTIFAYQPDRQHGSAEAFGYAAPLIAPNYLRRVGASATAWEPITAGTWARWSALHITVTATSRITTDDHPADTSNHVSRVIAVTQHPSNEPPRALTVYMQVTRNSAGSPWLVTDVEIK